MNEATVGIMFCVFLGILMYFVYYWGTHKYKEYFEKYHTCRNQMDLKHKEVSMLNGRIDVLKGRLDGAYKILNKTSEYDKEKKRFKKRETFYEV